MIVNTSIPRVRKQQAVAVGFALLACIAIATSALSGGAGVVSGNNTTINETAPYYNNESGNVTAEGWVAGPNATLDNIGDMATRFVSLFIGYGSLDPSGTGYEGVLIMGIIMGGVGLAAISGTRIGPVGGVILSMTVGYGLVGVGLAPVWVKTVLLFGIGIVASVALRRTLR